MYVNRDKNNVSNKVSFFHNLDTSIDNNSEKNISMNLVHKIL